MEASSNVDSPPFPAFGGCNNDNNINGGNNWLLRSASQQLLLGVPGVGGIGGGADFLGPRPPSYSSCPQPAPTRSSLPLSHHLQQPHPPLLPIPLSKFSSLPSPSPPASTWRVVGAAAVRPGNKDSKKMKYYPAKPQKDSQFGGTRPQKEPPAAMTTPVSVPKPAAAAASRFEDELPKEEGDLTGDVYSLSPPPSSLPMPKFSLRARTNAEEFVRGVLVGGGADAGASDDLRRLLRL